MAADQIIISGTGCALADYLYKNIRFDSPEFWKYASRQPGDGGLSPGKLVFTEELEKFAGRPYSEILAEITGNRQPDSVNIGGPGLVSLIHASQMLEGNDVVRFFGNAGKDRTGDTIFNLLEKMPLHIEGYRRESQRATPTTDVFSDPTYDRGHGERTFVNNIGAAWDYVPDSLEDRFFDADIVCFGGTALVPLIHDHLTPLLVKAKNRNCLTFVNTVFDFRNEKANPGKPWPLVHSRKDYELIDVLVMDREEAIRISGAQDIGEASRYFASTEVSAFVITNGAKDLVAWSGGKLFEKTGILELPVSSRVTAELKSDPEKRGDTTGCGDNFAGGIIASLARQIKRKEKGRFSLFDAVSWGVASGGFCCFTVGGTYMEPFPGEKRQKIEVLQQDYLRQIGR